MCLMPFHLLRSSHYYEPSFPQQPPVLRTCLHTHTPFCLEAAAGQKTCTQSNCIFDIHTFHHHVAVTAAMSFTPELAKQHSVTPNWLNNPPLARTGYTKVR